MWPVLVVDKFYIYAPYFIILLFYLVCLLYISLQQSSSSSETDNIHVKVASFTLWTLLPPQQFSPAVDVSGVLSPRLTSLCSGSIVLPASGMLTSTVLESTQTHMQTHLCLYTFVTAHMLSSLCQSSLWLVGVSKCKLCHIRTIYVWFTASGFVSVYSLPGNHVDTRDFFGSSMLLRNLS